MDKPVYGSTVIGLIMRFSSVEIVEHCLKREQYHLALSEKYKGRVATSFREKATAIEALHNATVIKFFLPNELFDDEEEKGDFGGKGAYARVSNAAGLGTQEDEEQAKHHRQRVKFFRTFGEHVIPGMWYMLSVHDISSLEMTN